MNNNIIKAEQVEYSPDQVELIKKQVAPQANDNELKLFLYQCRRTGLDPLVRQIYCIHRGGKMTIQTSIDGFRVIAERSGNYAGQSEPVFAEENGKIICCKVSVFKFGPQGQRYEAAVGVAHMSEYAQQGPMWTKMPHTMISKCAEAIALRKAFPQDLSGLYTTEEMNQADAPAETLTVEAPTQGELQDLSNMVSSSTLDPTTMAKVFARIGKCRDYTDYNKILHYLQDNQPSEDQVINPSQKDLNKMVSKKAAADA